MVGGLATSLTTTSYDTVSVTENRVSNVEGGYIKIGNLVVVNLRCVANIAIPSAWNVLMTGFPKPILRYNESGSAIALACYPGSDSSNAGFVINGVGALLNTNPVGQGDTLVISGTYFTK